LAQKLDCIRSAAPVPDSPEALWERLGAREVPDLADIEAFTGGPEVVSVMKVFLAADAQVVQQLAQIGLAFQWTFPIYDQAVEIAGTPLDRLPDPKFIGTIQETATKRPRTQDRETHADDFLYRRDWTALAVTAALGAPDGRPLREEIAAGAHSDAGQELPHGVGGIRNLRWMDPGWQHINCRAIQEPPGMPA
jgi:hypothetical protein